MSKYEEIKSLIAQIPPAYTAEEIPLERAAGRILREEIRADMPMPPFNKSAVDGFACRREDLEKVLDVIEEIPAGKMPQKKVGPGQCSRIMTGAAVPDGADIVFMLEDSKEKGKGRVQCLRNDTKVNICALGEDYAEGELLLAEGELLKAEHLAVIAGAGKDRVLVSAKMRAGLIVTGSELVEPEEKPAPGMIRNSNAVQLMTLLEDFGLDTIYYGLFPDHWEQLQETFQKALHENEIVVFTGGAAAGDFDLVPRLIESEGFSPQWIRTGLKPGNPMSYSTREGKHVFGLSGNPVSSLVQFEYLLKPLVHRLLGSNYKPFVFKGKLAADYQRKNPARHGIIPVKVNAEGLIEPVNFNGSAHINALAGANAFMEIRPGIKELKKGELADVRPL